ncbi:CBN-PQN-89 protein [Aphelenchoides bicaudatus]|nr:CBN-PQN-89 protein [Aphelenchoides bicaudatus]
MARRSLLICLLFLFHSISAQSVDYFDHGSANPAMNPSQQQLQQYPNNNQFPNNNNNNNQYQHISQRQTDQQNQLGQFGQQVGQQNQMSGNSQYDGQNQPLVNGGPNSFPHPNQQYPNNTGSNNDFSIDVQVQLRSYLNANSMLDASRTCLCNTGDCLMTTPQQMGSKCLFSFMIIVSSADSSVQYRATEFLALNSYGQIDSNSTNKFTEVQSFTLNNQPTAIDIFVHNLGPVINAYSKKLENSNTVYHVDTFVYPLNSTSAINSRSSTQMQQASLVGNLLGTQLSLSYSVSCRGNLIGAGCDLSCNSSAVNSNTAVCINRRTGFYSVCRWQSSKTQVTDCKNCPWGIKDNAYCMDESGGILEAHHAGVVSEGFRTATIILAILCGVFLLLIVLVIVVCCMRKPKQSRSSLRGQHNYESELLTQRNGDDIRPLNSSAPNPNTTFSTTASTPQPAPRNQPPLLSARPSKSLLRSPHLYTMPPAAHLTGGANSLNSSFSSTVPPVPPSVSADV